LVKSDSVTPANLVAKPPKIEPRPPERLLTDMRAAYSDASTPGGQMLAVEGVGFRVGGVRVGGLGLGVGVQVDKETPRPRGSVLGNRVWGSGFGVRCWGIGFGVQGLGFGVGE
jgi:hypothetical protein